MTNTHFADEAACTLEHDDTDTGVEGSFDLVELNTADPEVQSAISRWVQRGRRAIAAAIYQATGDAEQVDSAWPGIDDWADKAYDGGAGECGGLVLHARNDSDEPRRAALTALLPTGMRAESLAPDSIAVEAVEAPNSNVVYWDAGLLAPGTEVESAPVAIFSRPDIISHGIYLLTEVSHH